MKNKVFYNPDTLEIRGFSDGEVSMELPYIETHYNLKLIENFKIEETDGKLEVVPIKMQFTTEEWEKVVKE